MICGTSELCQELPPRCHILYWTPLGYNPEQDPIQLEAYPSMLLRHGQTHL
jgi:hypothetical protein